MRKNGGNRLCWSGVFSLGLACALVLALMAPGRAFAYFSYPAPVISAPGSVALASGETRAVTCAVSPMSERQLPGCGMAECPQACDGLETPGGVVGGCMSADGWCTCAGTSYVPVETHVTVNSSDPSVARASWSGGVLSVSGYKAGTATLSVQASLSKHESSEAVVSVNVSGSASGGGDGGAVATPGGGGSVSVGPSGGGAAAVVSRGGASDAGAGADGAGGAAQVVERQSADGARVVIVEATTAEAAVEQLERAADEGGDVTLWYGGTMDSPDISMEFAGADLDASVLAGFDPTARVSKKGEGALAQALAAVKRTIVVTFAAPGSLPATADVHVRASLVFGDGDVVGLYRYSDDGTFSLVQGGVEVSGGYAHFQLEDAATYVLSDEDLTALGIGRVDAGGVDATQVNTQAESGIPYLAAAAVLAVAVVAGGIAYSMRRRMPAHDPREPEATGSGRCEGGDCADA